MKLRNIAKKENKPLNINLRKEDKLILPNEEFEVSDDRAKELLEQTVEDKPIVEVVKDTKSKLETNKEA
jgi:hypothetical protein